MLHKDVNCGLRCACVSSACIDFGVEEANGSDVLFLAYLLFPVCMCDVSCIMCITMTGKSSSDAAPADDNTLKAFKDSFPAPL